MNKVNFLNKDNFPLYSEGLAKLQDTIFLTAQLALLGGANYILSGCIDDGKGNISDGMVVINGEILELVGAAKKDKITIREIRTPLTAFGVEYPESYTTRYVEFSNTGDLVWDDFEAIPTNQKLHEQIKNITGDPVSTVKEFAGFIDKIPKDYMLCDGRDMSVAEYPELFEYIGTIYGGDGVNSFKLPNAGGRVVVGYTGGGDYDKQGNTGGKESVKLSTAELPEHDHTNSSIFNKLSARAADVSVIGTPSGIDEKSPEAEYNVGNMDASRWESATIQKVGGNKEHENRQPYIVFAKIIKVK